MDGAAATERLNSVEEEDAYVIGVEGACRQRSNRDVPLGERFRKLKKDLTVTVIARMFDTTKRTVYRWLGRGKHHPGKEAFKDKPRQLKESKVTLEVTINSQT